MGGETLRHGARRLLINAPQIHARCVPTEDLIRAATQRGFVDDAIPEPPIKSLPRAIGARKNVVNVDNILGIAGLVSAAVEFPKYAAPVPLRKPRPNVAVRGANTE